MNGVGLAMRGGLIRRGGAAALLALMLAAMGGCNIFAIFGLMAESYQQEASHTVAPEYTGLDKKSFAVVVTADRLIQADFPQVVARLSLRISDDLAKNANANGFVPGSTVLEYQFNHPQVISYTQMAKELGVQRLVVIELLDYRLNDPGNQYLWKGVASGVVNVIEADSPLAEDYAYSKTLTVGYPDQDGNSPENMSREVVNSELSRRFVNRTSWLFYEHDEKMRPDY